MSSNIADGAHHAFVLSMHDFPTTSDLDSPVILRAIAGRLVQESSIRLQSTQFTGLALAICLDNEIPQPAQYANLRTEKTLALRIID